MFPSIKNLPPPPPDNEKIKKEVGKTTTNENSIPTITTVITKPTSTYSSLQCIERLLPHIQISIKESKSTVARDIISRMAINNKILFYELAAIRIQSLIRTFLSQLRCHRIKRRKELFLNITEYCARRYLEEFVLSTCFEISLEFYRQHQRYKILKNTVEKEIILSCDNIINEILIELVLEIANTTIKDAIDVVITLRYAYKYIQYSTSFFILSTVYG